MDKHYPLFRVAIIEIFSMKPTKERVGLLFVAG